MAIEYSHLEIDREIETFASLKGTIDMKKAIYYYLGRPWRWRRAGGHFRSTSRARRNLTRFLLDYVATSDERLAG